MMDLDKAGASNAGELRREFEAFMDLLPHVGAERQAEGEINWHEATRLI